MAAASPRSRRRTSIVVLAGALGGLFGLAGALLYWVVSFRDPLPPLTAAQFAEAQQRWRENGPEDYDVEVEVFGRQAARYRVEVRRSQAVAAFRNGQPLGQKRTWETWSVPGMFNTLGSDFRHVERVAAGAADETTPRLALYGIFHPQYGYPQRYRRVMLGQGREESMAHRVGQGGAGSAFDVEAAEVSWIVRTFAIRSAPREASAGR